MFPDAAYPQRFLHQVKNLVALVLFKARRGNNEVVHCRAWHAEPLVLHRLGFHYLHHGDPVRVSLTCSHPRTEPSVMPFASATRSNTGRP